MQNTSEGFKEFAITRGITLTSSQEGVARQLFSIPLAGGKSTLTALLYKYDQEVMTQMERKEKGS